MMSMMRTDGGDLAVLADAVGEAPMTALMVRQVRWEADDVISIELTAPDGGPLPEWEPGAHVWEGHEQVGARNAARAAMAWRRMALLLREQDGSA